jgi:hypothetical protein
MRYPAREWLSVEAPHVMLMRSEEYGVTLTPVGVDGGVVSVLANVVALTVPAGERLPAASSARTANV